jgi:hypothetical protein
VNLTSKWYLCFKAEAYLPWIVTGNLIVHVNYVLTLSFNIGLGFVCFIWIKIKI